MSTSQEDIIDDVDGPHEGPPLEAACPFCDRTFNDEDDLDDHLTFEHGDDMAGDGDLPETGNLGAQDELLLTKPEFPISQMHPVLMDLLTKTINIKDVDMICDQLNNNEDNNKDGNDVIVLSDNDDLDNGDNLVPQATQKPEPMGGDIQLSELLSYMYGRNPEKLLSHIDEHGKDVAPNHPKIVSETIKMHSNMLACYVASMDYILNKQKKPEVGSRRKNSVTKRVVENLSSSPEKAPDTVRVDGKSDENVESVKAMYSIKQVPLEDATDSRESTMEESELRPYKCAKCGERFVSRHALQLHDHNDRKRFKCQTCSKMFAWRKSLEIHVRCHLGGSYEGRPHKCWLCERAFFYPAHLRQHMTTHTQNKPHTCKICGNRYSRRGNLTIHMRVHANYRPYPCRVCGRAFHQSSTLKIHMRLHTGEKPYVCKECGKGFTQGHHLKIHIGNHKKRQSLMMEQSNQEEDITNDVINDSECHDEHNDVPQDLTTG